MLRAIAILLVVSVCLSSRLDSAEIFPTAKHGRGELRTVDTIPIAILVGTPEEIGAQHAALLAKYSNELLAFPKRLFTESGMEFFYPLAAQAGKTLMLNAPERYQQELAALAKGANLDAETFAVANTLLELRRIGCSTLIVEPGKSATGELLFGRNFDFPAFGVLDRYSVVTIIHPEGKHAFAAVGYPGMVGVISGMNDTGLCVATLDVEETADGSIRFDASGVPMTLTFRQILEECKTVEEAEALLKRSHATTQANLAVCDREQGVIFEITPKQVARREANGAVLTCTNHFRMPGLAANQECWRYDRLQAAGDKQRLSVADIQAALDSANQGELTLQTMVFEPRELVLHLALGTPPSSAHKMHRVELRDLLLPK
jgi:hypothetical protein